MKRKDLASKKCVPCEGGIEAFDRDTAHVYLLDLPGWKLSENAKKISKEFEFKDFMDALTFTNAVGKLSESENHHPDILLSWGKIVVTLWTHAIKGLSENDFIVAAKIESLV